jgi:hypothetical protein
MMQGVLGERDAMASERSDNKLHISASAVPALRLVAAELSGRLGRELNFAQAYVALLSAEQAGAITPQSWAESPQDPTMLNKVSALLLQHPELLEELLNQKQLQNAESLVDNLE